MSDPAGLPARLPSGPDPTVIYTTWLGQYLVAAQICRRSEAKPYLGMSSFACGGIYRRTQYQLVSKATIFCANYMALRNPVRNRAASCLYTSAFRSNRLRSSSVITRTSFAG